MPGARCAERALGDEADARRVQLHGGEGLSGTGPKAGGPHYLLRFLTERTLTVNTAAVGGNARLLAAS